MQNISDAEKEIMQIIWKNNNAIFVSDLLEVIKKRGFSWSDSTVRTFLARLIDKGYLITEKHGKTAKYIACLGEDEYLSKQAHAFVKTMFDGSVKGLLNSLFGQNSLEEAQMKALEEFWEKGKEEIE